MSTSEYRLRTPEKAGPALVACVIFGVFRVHTKKLKKISRKSGTESPQKLSIYVRALRSSVIISLYGGSTDGQKTAKAVGGYAAPARDAHSQPLTPNSGQHARWVLPAGRYTGWAHRQD